MNRIIFLILVVLTSALLGTPGHAQTPYCDLAGSTPLTLSPRDFEGDEGWRRWGEGGCKAAAADLIAAYRSANREQLDQGDRVLLVFHEAQLRASGQDYASALVLLEGIEGQAASSATELYHGATRAFLRRDLQGLTAARETLAALPAPPAFERAKADFVARYGGQGPQWPLNLDVVDGLIRCFDQPYEIAYNCREANP